MRYKAKTKKGSPWEGGAPAPPAAEDLAETPFGEAGASPSQETPLRSSLVRDSRVASWTEGDPPSPLYVLFLYFYIKIQKQNIQGRGRVALCPGSYPGIPHERRAKRSLLGGRGTCLAKRRFGQIFGCWRGRCPALPGAAFLRFRLVSH